LWVADRNFSTTRWFEGFAAQGAVFIVRKPRRSPTVVEAGPVRRAGRTATGTVDEQPVTLTCSDGRTLRLRQVRVHLAAPTQDGDTTFVLLTNVPATRLTARAIAEHYRGRWTIEGMFGELEAALVGELRTLGQPKAARFAFGLAVLAFNVLQVVRRAVEATHTIDGDVPAVSSYHVAVEIRATYQGFAIATDDTDWAPGMPSTTHASRPCCGRSRRDWILPRCGRVGARRRSPCPKATSRGVSRSAITPRRG